MEEAMLSGLLGYLPNFYTKRHQWLNVRWVPMGFDWVDPAKEVQASLEAVAGGLSTRSEEIAGRTGGDWEEFQDQALREEKREIDRRKEMGLPEKPLPGAEDKKPAAKPAPKKEKPDDEQD